MSLIDTIYRYDFAVLWAKAASDPGPQFDTFGQPIVAGPVEIQVRWEDKQVEFVSKDGTREISQAVVYPDRDIAPGSLIAHCRLKALIDQANPKGNPGVIEVKGFAAIPNKRRTKILRMAYLAP